MNKVSAVIAGIVLLGLLILFSATYTVSFHEVAIKTRFGKTNEDSIRVEPGLELKLPMPAERVTTIDTRLQLLATPMETVPTADGQQVVVEGFMLWRVDTEGDGPLRFFRSYGGSADDANRLMRDDFLTVMRRELSRYSFAELLGPENRLAEAEERILQAMSPGAGGASEGVLPVVVGVSRMQLPAKTARAVLDRMQATRERLSEAERFKGTAEAERIESDATTKADKIRAFARQRAEEIRAIGDEKAAEYLTQMSADEDFAIFLLWLQALESSLGQYTTIVLEATNEPWHLLKWGAGRDTRGIPQPEGGYLKDIELAGPREGGGTPSGGEGP